MSQNGQPAHIGTLAQRRDPRFVAALEAKIVEQAAQLVNRAISDGSVLANTLHHLTEQTNGGNASARAVLTLLLNNLDEARAAVKGIAIVRDTPPPLD